jgi:transcriptional regulator with XRE-family HTH domain
MDARSLVGSNLRRLRIARGLTQEALGFAADCEPSYVGRLERGAENPTVDLLASLARALDSPIGALFEPIPSNYVPPPHLPPGRKRRAG